MSSWGNKDNAANAPLWACQTVNLSANTTNIEKLFENETANDVIQNVTVGVFAQTVDEVAESNGTHIGWIKKTVGQGGRAGRVQQEVLVAMSNIAEVASDTLFRVRYDKNGGSAGKVPVDTTKYKSNESATVKGWTSSVTDGWQFDKWTTQASGGDDVSVGSSITVTSDTTLFANWKVQISYEGGADDVEGMPDASFVTKGGSSTVSSTVPTRTGFTFNKWSGSDGSEYASGADITVNEPVVLTATWTES